MNGHNRAVNSEHPFVLIWIWNLLTTLFLFFEDERDDNEVVALDYEQIDRVDNNPMQVLREQSVGFMSYIERYGCIRDQEIHFQL